MILLRSDLIKFKAPVAKTVRVLWLSGDGKAFVIDVDDRCALPEQIQVGELSAAISEGIACRMDEDPHLTMKDEESLAASSTSVRDRAWTLIESLVGLEPDIYDPTHRAEKVADLEEKKLATRVTIYKHLRRYWQRGLVKNALLPDFPNCGAKNEIREPSDIKRGRPRLYGDQPGVNVDAELRRIFQASVDKFYTTHGEKFTKKGAFEEMLRECFCEKTIDSETGLTIHSPLDLYAKKGFPTQDEFNYWFDRENSKLEIKRRRMGERRYDLTERGLIGTSTSETWGPGARYQIDATIADVFLVSRYNRRRVIGRPVLYIVIDVFSRMIVGLYIGLEGPSWVGAMMALANCAADKVSFCRQFGRPIKPEEWPCHFLPATLLGDRGEIESAKIKSLNNNFNVTVETARAYAADWKGIVERRFRLLPAQFKPYVPGYINVDYRIRGGTDYRLDATLDLDQFTKIIIHCILYFNNQHEIARYDQDRDVAADGVPAIPVDLWEWGVRNTSGRLRSFPEDAVRFSLLPTDQASVTMFGLQHKGSFYTCSKAMEERWFDRARQDGQWKVKISYDPRDVDRIYLHDPKAPTKYHTCTLTERSRAHRALSLWEVDQQLQLDKHAKANRKQDQQLAKADLSANIEAVVAEARALKPDMTGASAASQTKGIQANKSFAGRLALSARLMVHGSCASYSEEQSLVRSTFGLCRLASCRC